MHNISVANFVKQISRLFMSYVPLDSFSRRPITHTH